MLTNVISNHRHYHLCWSLPLSIVLLQLLSSFWLCAFLFISQINFRSYIFMIHWHSCFISYRKDSRLRGLFTLFLLWLYAFAFGQFSIHYIAICFIAIVFHFFIVFNENEITISACNWIFAFTFYHELHWNWYLLLFCKLVNNLEAAFISCISEVVRFSPSLKYGMS